MGTQNAQTPDVLTILEDKPGPGKLIAEGDKVVLQYRVWDGTGRELADSTKRGMPFTMVLGRRNSDKLFSVALAGMHAGGIRTAQIPASLVPEGLGGIVPPKTDLHIWIFAVAAKQIDFPAGDANLAVARPLKRAKVESTHAERTQGAMEVPRAAHHDGSART